MYYFNFYLFTSLWDNPIKRKIHQMIFINCCTLTSMKGL
ncbi:hypothetical protein pb186bvf_010303 [Paramecium bursaria]